MKEGRQCITPGIVVCSTTRMTLRKIEQRRKLRWIDGRWAHTSWPPPDRYPPAMACPAAPAAPL